LLGHARVIMRAIQARAQVGPAVHARFAAPRLAIQRPGLAAVMAMTRQRRLRFMVYDLRFEQHYRRRANQQSKIINHKF
jgi:hypothetical protein